jgi:uncharacterized membrane protein
MDIKDTLEIAAPVEEVWALTLDVERWPEMTPTITSVVKTGSGPLAIGSTARIKQPGMRMATWTVTELEPNHRFVWETKLGTVTLSGIHELAPGDAGCQNSLSIELSGFGSVLLRAVAGSRLRKTIATENLGFKHAAETRVAGR